MNAQIPIFEIIKANAEKNGKKFSEVEKEAGFPRGSLKNTKNHSASIETVVRLADYFGMSVDALIGRTSTGYLSSEETRLLSMFRSMNEQGKAFLLQSAEIASKTYIKSVAVSEEDIDVHA